jgi:hypothetical protein
MGAVYSCDGRWCGRIALATSGSGNLPPGWVTDERPDGTLEDLCPECVRAGVMEHMEASSDARAGQRPRNGSPGNQREG